MSTLVKADALSGDSPVQKLAPELLSKILLLCISGSTLPEPGVEPGESPGFKYGMGLQVARGRLAQVCQWWNAVLNDDPRVWARVTYDTHRPISSQTVMLWIERSKSHPLDIYIKLWPYLTDDWSSCCILTDTHSALVPIFHAHFWRIRSLVWRSYCREHSHLILLIPPCEPEIYAPMMQNLCLLGNRSEWWPNLGNIHCPNLRTLTIKNCNEAVEVLISKPMPNVHHLYLVSDGPVALYIKLLNVLPNLLSLAWRSQYGRAVEAPNSPMVLQSLKSLTLIDIPPHYLACFYAPSLESLNLSGHAANLINVLKIIRQDWNIMLRHLTITGKLPEETAIHAMLPYLTHLETLIVRTHKANSVDELLMALSTHNRDFTLACPQLKTMEINRGRVSTSALVSFVWRRVKPDLDDPVPVLMTSLKLSRIPVDPEVCEQLFKSHGSSVQIQLK